MIDLQQISSDRWQISGEFSVDSADESCDLIINNCDLSTQLTCDLSGVVRMDSAGLAALIEVQKRSHAENGAIKFINTPSQVMNLVKIARADQLLDITD